MVTRVLVGGVLPSSMQAPTGGNQFLIAQNGPIIAHTADGVAFTSALRVMVAAEAGAIAILRMAVRPSTARPVSGSFGSLGNFLIGSPYHLKVECAARHLSPACGDRGRVRVQASPSPLSGALTAGAARG